MKKFYSLLKAILSQDMNILKVDYSNSKSKLKRIILPIIIVIILLYTAAFYCYMLAKPLSEINLTYIMLTQMTFVVTIICFIEGIYKSQGILFDGKDNDLLFSLPIKKTHIFALRTFKLLIFQFIFNLFFMLPAYGIYIYFEKTSFNFYIISLIMLFILPIIPTIISSLIGYLVKVISVKFKAKKIVQIILSTIVCIGVFFLSFNLEDLINNLVENAISINDFISKLYFPIGSYINLINKFDLILFIKLLLVNVIPLIVVIYLGSIYYFKIISKTSESGTNKVKHLKDIKIKTTSSLKSLIKKEINRYFSSAVYIFNTSFGDFIMLAITIAVCINSDRFIDMFLVQEDFGLNVDKVMTYLPIAYLALILFSSCMTSITSSSISLEGNSFNITKSLPVKTEKILLSKILTSNIICIPLMVISEIIFVIKFNLSIKYLIIYLLFTILVPTLTAMLGLIINLKYPKMKFTNDTEVVKQSISTLISVYSGMLILAILIFVTIKFIDSFNLIIVIELVSILIIDILLWILLKKYGIKRFREINV